MDDRGGGGLPRAGRRAKAPESGRMAAGEGSGATGNSATLGWDWGIQLSFDPDNSDLPPFLKIIIVVVDFFIYI
jgi:hypothetical protein